MMPWLLLGDIYIALINIHYLSTPGNKSISPSPCPKPPACHGCPSPRPPQLVFGTSCCPVGPGRPRRTFWGAVVGCSAALQLPCFKG